MLDQGAFTYTPVTATIHPSMLRDNHSTSTPLSDESDESTKAEIQVGEANVAFWVDYALLTDNRSPLLKHSLNQFNGAVHLKYDNVEAFADYWTCIKYGAEKIELKPGCDGADGVVVDVFAGLAEVWILAHMLVSNSKWLGVKGMPCFSAVGEGC